MFIAGSQGAAVCTACSPGTFSGSGNLPVAPKAVSDGCILRRDFHGELLQLSALEHALIANKFPHAGLLTNPSPV